MFLASLVLSRFRNYNSLELSCPPGLSVFLGENAQGKSNLLEAIYFISTGRSFRTNKVQELVQWGADRFELSCRIEFSGASHRLDASVGTGQGRYLLDGKPKRAAAVFGNFQAVIFASEDMDVVRQEPALRRRFFDLFFSQIDKSYGKHLDDYLRVVKNRNALLKSERFGEMDVWNDLLAREGGWLAWRRKKLLAEFEKTAAAHHDLVSVGSEVLQLAYKTSCTGDSADEAEASLRRKIAEHEEHEKILKTTMSGPHRDDYEITLGAKAARNFGSEGQKRSVMLSLRMAQWKFLAGLTGEKPMILLDDVLGELDEERQAAFLDMVVQSGAQSFIALTEAKDFLRRAAGAVFQVSSGVLAGGVGREERAATS